METRFQFNGTGGALFVKFLVGGLLTVITFGIYLPWFIVNLTKYVYENTIIKSPAGDLRLDFTGAGGKLFGTYLVGVILTMLTVGIYGAWFMTNMAKFFTDNTKCTGPDGRQYQLQYNGTGGALFVKVLVGYLLTMVTLGIYGPWFMCSLTKFILENTAIMEGSNQIGSFDFVGAGGALFVTYLVGFLLTMITFGIYGAWFAVKLFKFFNENTEVTVGDQKYRCGFVGTGGNFFVLNLVGYLLTMITFGIYGAWYYCNLIKFQLENTTVSNNKS